MRRDRIMTMCQVITTSDVRTTEKPILSTWRVPESTKLTQTVRESDSTHQLETVRPIPYCGGCCICRKIRHRKSCPGNNAVCIGITVWIAQNYGKGQVGGVAICISALTGTAERRMMSTTGPSSTLPRRDVMDRNVDYWA